MRKAPQLFPDLSRFSEFPARAGFRPAHARTVLERQIAATDRQIDQLVYQLYGLTDDEIALVEVPGPK